MNRSSAKRTLSVVFVMALGAAGTLHANSPPDADHDGVYDSSDQCLQKPETINGIRDDDGCPDRGPSPLWRATGDAARGTLRLSGEIRLEHDETVGRNAKASVDQLARELIARLPMRFHVAIAATPRAGSESVYYLTQALIERGVPAEHVEVELDPTLRGVHVRVTARR